MGGRFLKRVQKISNPHIIDVRGRGLFVGVELDTKARPYCERLAGEGVLAKETHDNVIRFAPPLTITEEEMEWALQRIEKVLSAKTGQVAVAGERAGDR